MRLPILLVLGMPALFAAGVEGFNGRWNLTVPKDPRARAWWLEVEGAGTAKLRGKFVGAPGGQVDVIPQIRLEKSELVWVFDKPGDRRVYRAALTAAGLNGRMDIDGAPQSSLTFTGKRAPELKEKDDGSWKPGQPVELFNGRDMSGFVTRVPGKPVDWYVEKGAMKNRDKAADIMSTAKFWNFRAHIEYRVAQHSNSGIGLRGRYEIQIYGDHGEPPSEHGNGALYSRIAPRVNATLAPDQWQVCDITLIGRELTVVMNGKKLHDRVTVEGLTAMGHDPNEDQPGPLSLQGDHGPVEFRKITITPLTR